MRLTHLAVIVVVLLSSSSLAQMRGGGARGFSGRPGVAMPHHGVRVFVGSGFNNGPFFNGPFFPGVPASVTSLGPCGFTPCFRPFFRFRHFHRFPIFDGSFVSAFPVAVPVPVAGDNLAVDPQPQAQQQPLLPSRLEVTIVDGRGGGQKSEDAPSADRPKDAKLSDVPAEPAIFIFKDGSRKQLTNFAIMNGQLIDLSNGKIFRTPLDQVDRKATLAANAKAGRAIQLP